MCVHKWVQVKDVHWNDKSDVSKKGIYLFCENCHAVCKVALYGELPNFVYVKKEVVK